MAKVRVYQYDYFDPLLKRERRFVDFATGDAIAQKGGTIIAESMREVDEELLSDEGVIRAGNMPPREIPSDEPVRKREVGPNPAARPSSGRAPAGRGRRTSG